MKTFKQLRESRGKMPPGQHVSDMKVGKNSIMIHKDKGKFVAYIEGEKLDSYSSQKEAERMAQEFIKQYKG
jgi:hypothetical protein